MIGKSDRQYQRIRRRRLRNVALFVVAMLLFLWWVDWQNRHLIRSSFATGYVLFAAIVFLTAFNLRKRLTFLPQLGSAAFWMQLHIYVGLATFVFFGCHIAWRVPNGWFERVLALLYVGVAGSGVYGLYLTRFMPRRLAGLPEEVLFERIPALRNSLAAKTRELVVQARSASDVLARFYLNRLARFFERPRGLAYLVYPTGRERRQLVSEIQALDRYLGEEQRQVGRELQSLVCKKDDLDYHYAIQGRLKIWLFVHIGLTYGLLIYATVHGVMAQSFGGGLR